MFSTKRIFSAILIGAVLALPLAFGAAAEASKSPSASSETLRTPKTAHDEPLALSVWQLPDAPAKAPSVQRVRETIIVAQVEAPKTFICGNWEDSAAGGSYRRCEWR